jgi:hypothetical protein
MEGGGLSSSLSTTTSVTITPTTAGTLTLTGKMFDSAGTEYAHTSWGTDTVTVTTGTAFQLGDVNHNGSIQGTDAALIARFIVNGRQNPIPGYTGIFDEDLADMNQNGTIMSTDAAAVAHYVVTQ